MSHRTSDSDGVNLIVPFTPEKAYFLNIAVPTLSSCFLPQISPRGQEGEGQAQTPGFCECRSPSRRSGTQARLRSRCPGNGLPSPAPIPSPCWGLPPLLAYFLPCHLSSCCLQKLLEKHPPSNPQAVICILAEDQPPYNLDPGLEEKGG